MPIYNVVGDAIVSEAELIEKRTNGDLDGFMESLASGSEDAFVDFSTGRLRASQAIVRKSQASTGTALEKVSTPLLLLKQDHMDEIAQVERAEDVAKDTLVPFEKVGYGRPLTVEIRHVYTGEHPHTLFGGGTGMLVTSAIKSVDTFDKAARAVNILKSNVQVGEHVQGPPAVEDGTRLVYYTPALTDASLSLTLEASFDNYDPGVLEAVSSAMTKAGGLPLFASASVALGPYAAPAAVLLLAGGMATKIVGNLLRSRFDREPEFSATDSLSVGHPGEELLTEGFKLVTEADVDEAWRDEHRCGPDGVVRDRDRRRYRGDVSYMVISVDGRENDKYKQFTATAASAKLLEQYYGLGEQKMEPLEALVQGISLYSDLKYRHEADALAKKIEALGDNGDAEELKKLKQQHEAMVKKISEDKLKP